MKIVKYLSITILSLLSLILIIAWFAPSEYHVEKEVSVNKSKQEVFDYVVLLKNQNHYSAWAKMDLNMKRTYVGRDGSVGFISAWDSHNENVGKGEQEIIKVVGNERIEYELRFEKPFKSSDPAYIQLDAIYDTKTSVKWGFDGEMDYPMNILLLFLDMDKQLGGDLQTGLNNLKMILESETQNDEI